MGSKPFLYFGCCPSQAFRKREGDLLTNPPPTHQPNPPHTALENRILRRMRIKRIHNEDWCTASVYVVCAILHCLNIDWIDLRVSIKIDCKVWVILRKSGCAAWRQFPQLVKNSNSFFDTEHLRQLIVLLLFCFLISFHLSCISQGAFWGMMIGFVIGTIRMVMDFSYQAPRCGEVDQRPGVIANVHYMYFAMILFWITSLIVIIISCFTEPPDQEKVTRSWYELLHYIMIYTRPS